MRRLRGGGILIFLTTVISPIQIIVFDDWEASATICTAAVTDAKAAGTCTSQFVEIIRQDGCSSENSVKCASIAINKVASQNSTLDIIFVGPQCPTDVLTIADFATIWKTPVIGIVPDLRLLDTSSTSTSTYINIASYSAAGILDGLAALLKEIGIGSGNFTLVGAVQQSKIQPSLLELLEMYNKKAKTLEFTKVLRIREHEDTIADFANDVRKSYQTVVICTDWDNIYDALLALGLRQLSSFRFILILLLKRPPDEVLVQSNLKNMIYGSNTFMIGPASSKYSEHLVQMTNIYSSMESTRYSDFLWTYNACYSWCYGSTIGAETSVTDYAGLMKGRTITNSFGTFNFDQSATILTDYAVYSIQPDNMDFEVIMTLKVTARACDANHKCFDMIPQVFDDELWSAKTLAPPDDCVANNECTNYIPYIIAGAIFGVICLFILIAVIIAKVGKNNVYRLTWKVPKESLKIIVNKNADTRMQRELENRRANADGKTTQEGIAMRRRVFGSYALVGTQRAEFIFFRQLKKIKWTEEQLKYLYNLKQLQNDNLTKFIGINYNDSDYFYILHSLIDRLTLEECCIDLDFQMDSTFKSAFMRDILKGLSYLHKSSIGYHGFLRSSTCLIDNNWVLKLTDYGVSNMISKFYDDATLKDAESLAVSHTQFAWFPPEHLKEYDATGKSSPRFVEGSVEGDIYCVGLIFYEMIFRVDPFSPNPTFDRSNMISINDIINNNLMPTTKSNGIEDLLIDMLSTCWDRDPKKRPNIKKLTDCISATYPASKGNLVDQMIKMSEVYAADLNKIVQERTALLAEAEAQTMRLLNEMLPASIAKELKDGKTVAPQSYDSATVMFTQICDFPVLMNQSSPDQIIFFLNDVFDNFDTIIKNHDAYKVETTGETYMVASGVPSRNEGRHIFEIAEISLEIRDVSYKYVVKNNKDFKLRVKIGFHAGPIAAGVIGIRSPRYCLFGDTVNFASRMQSNCPPNQIQTSEQTANLLFASHEYKLVKRGIVHVKGKGEVNCYWLNEHIHEDMVEVTNPTKPLTESGTLAALAKTDIQ